MAAIISSRKFPTPTLRGDALGRSSSASQSPEEIQAVHFAYARAKANAPFPIA